MRLWLAFILCLLPSLTFAQIQPAGSNFTPGHTVRVLNPQGTAVGDAGGAAGSSLQGQGYLTELGITAPGTPLCINDALTNSPSGYHQFCIGANSLGGGLISYNAYGGAPQLNLLCNINGIMQACFGSQAAVFPTTSAPPDVVTFGDTGGHTMFDTFPPTLSRSVLTQWGPLSAVVGANGAKNAFLGVTSNNAAPGTLAFPAGVNGYGRVESGASGNQAFGVFGQCDLRDTGTCPGAEFTSTNFAGTPDKGLPPSVTIPNGTHVSTGANFTCGTGAGTNDCSIGVLIANNDGVSTDPVFNTGEFIYFYRQYGLFINAMPSGTQTSEVIQNNGNGVNLQMQFTGTPNPANTVADVVDNNSNPRFSIRQNGDTYTTGHVLFNQTAAGGARPTVSSCGTSPSVNRSNDQAGIITVGSGTVTSCTVVFATAFQQIPACTVSGEAGMAALLISSKTVNALAVTSGGPNMAGFNFDYICFDQP